MTADRDRITFATVSGRVIDLENLRPSDFDIRDIATSLARQCRYNGHTDAHYSVAQHSLIVSCVVEAKVAERVGGGGGGDRVALANGLRERKDYDFLVEEAMALALLHDAHEMITGDVIGPFKRLLSKHTDFLPAFEKQIDECIRERFGLRNPEEVEYGGGRSLASVIKEADHRVLLWEQRELRHIDSRMHPDHVERGGLEEGFPFFADPLPAEKARELFLKRWRRCAV